MQVTARSHTYIKQSFLNLEGITPINCMKKRNIGFSPYSLKLRLNLTANSWHDTFAMNAASDLKVVFTPKWSNETKLQRTDAQMPRSRDTPKEKEKKKSKKKSSGVTHHYNTKTNKKYYNQ